MGFHKKLETEKESMVLENVIIRHKSHGYCRVNILIQESVIKKIDIVEKQIQDFSNNTYSFFVTPGFVNSHLHPNQLFDRRILDGLDLHALLQKMHTQYNKTEQDRYMHALFVVLDAIRCGATTLYSVASYPMPVINAYKTIGAKGAVSCFFNDQWETKDEPPPVMPLDTIEEQFAALITQKTDNVAIHIGTASIRSASNRLLVLLDDLAKKYNTRVNMHVSECAEDVVLCKKFRGTTPIRLLDQLGVLHDIWNLIHVVAIDEHEIELLARRGTSVVHCPISNAKTGVGIAPVPQMLKKGVSVGLGTDACSNNNTNNIMNEAYFALLLHAANNKNATIISLEEIMHFLITNGYAMLGKKQKGIIQEGEPADILLWELYTNSFVPLCYGNFESAIFYNAPDIKPHTVIIDGKKIVENYTFTNFVEKEIMNQANRCACKFYKSH